MVRELDNDQIAELVRLVLAESDLTQLGQELTKVNQSLYQAYTWRFFRERVESFHRLLSSNRFNKALSIKVEQQITILDPNIKGDRLGNI
jgi:hypothetical protein